MKLKTSFFNTTLLRKDLMRFAPTWVLYTVFLVLVFSGNILSYNRVNVASSLGDSVGAFSILNLLYAMLCAQLLFGDLFQSRLCNALHALPIRREGWFLTHVLSGLAFCAIPVAAAGLVFLAVLGSYWMAALLWMAALILQFFFFYAVAVLSCMLVGNRFAAVVVYAILNFLSAIALWLFYSLYKPHLYGFVLDETPLLRFCPAVWLVQHSWFTGVSKTGSVLVQEGWGYLAICFGVGLALMALALLLYRKRALEKAGDFVVFRQTAPVFLILYTFSAGAFLHLFSNAFIGESTEFVFLIVGLAIGFFTGLMLLRRTIRVFRGRTFAQFAILMAAFGLSLLLTVLDPVGITRWTPKQENIQWASLDYYASVDQQEHAITDPELIKQILSVHQHAVTHPEEASNGEKDANIMFSYKLKNGQLAQRQFYVDTNTVAGMTLEYILSQPEILFGSDFTTVDAMMEEIKFVDLGKNGMEEMLTDREQIRSLLEAVIADAEAGNLCQNWTLRQDNGTDDGYIYFECKEYTNPVGTKTSHYWHISYTPQSTNITAWLKNYYGK